MPVEEALTAGPVVVAAAHPDDETIGAGGLLPRLRLAAIVHVTDGAPRNSADARAAGYERWEDYARARKQELLNALELAGISPEQTHGLDIPDQAASLALADLARRMAAFLRELRPAMALTHPYEGGHPDHDATAFAVHAACALMPAPPKIYEFTSYHALAGEAEGPPRMECGLFPMGRDPGQAVVLSTEARERKIRMLECFASQLHMLRHFPVDVERFRGAPVYDFTLAPHAGKLFYDNFQWGMTGDRWRHLAAEAMRTLGIQGTI